MLIVFAGKFTYLQIIVMTYNCLFVVIIFSYKVTFNLSRDQMLEYFNEATILICVYHLFIFTDYVDNVNARFVMGYSLVFFAFLNLLVNVLVLITVTISNMNW